MTIGINQQDWRDWFAWKPVAFGHHIVWLKTIQRQYNHFEECWYYRRLPSEIMKDTK